MSAVTFSLRDFYDAATEYVGIKAGLLIDREIFKKILLETFDQDYLKKDDLKKFVRIRVEDIESMFTYVRKRVGNLPTESQTRKDYQVMKEYLQKTGDIHSLGISTSLVNNLLQENINFSPEQIARRIHKEKKLPIEISRAMANIGYERCDESCIIPSSKKWDKASKLSDLFNCEINSENENIFLEQKFLDYLAVNGHEIETIHWRNFERFCAEYFRREGYKVILGPGSNDGGVDIRVFSDTSKTTAPHMLIQCKRYKAENKVSIETVKSFYTDVLFENATTGLIATSSYIAPGGKSICDTRGYNLKFAEAENIRNWGRNMWKYSKPEQNLNR